MASLNRTQIIGNVGRDPEVRYTTSGKAVCSFSVACSETWTTGGERHEHTEWFRVQMWDRMAEVAGEYLKKGSQVYVEGRLRTRQYQDKDGNDRTTTELIGDRMVLLGRRDDADGEKPKQKPAQKPAQKANTGTGFDDMDDDIPFD